MAHRPPTPRTDPRSNADKARILFVAANPSDTTRVAVGEEHREIDARIRASDCRDRFELTYAHEVRAGELARALLRYRPTVLHFSGHGSREGELLLPDAVGRATPIQPDAVKQLFGALDGELAIRCVLLNACYSDALAEALAEYVDCVIGMPSSVKDRAAITFAGGFYEALGFGRSVEAAFRIACAQVGLVQPTTGALPNLHCRSGVRPDLVRVVLPLEPGAALTFGEWLDVVFGGRRGRLLSATIAALVTLAFFSGVGLHALLALAGLGGATWGVTRYRSRHRAPARDDANEPTPSTDEAEPPAQESEDAPIEPAAKGHATREARWGAAKSTPDAAAKTWMLTGAFVAGVSVGAGVVSLRSPKRVVLERRVEVRVPGPERVVVREVVQRAEEAAPVMVAGASATTPAERTTTVHRAAAPDTPASRLAAERAIVEQANSALLRGNHTAALAAVQAHRQRFPNGGMSEERDSLWVRALAGLGRVAEARARAADFHRRYPSSMLGVTVDRAVRPGDPLRPAVLVTE